jgi:hypothetical protein
MKNEVIKQVQQCNICQLNKGEHTPYPGLLEPISIPKGAWEVITMDFISGLPKNEDKDVIMVVIDKLTKYCHLIALSHPFSATTVAERFLETVHKLHGLPVRIITNKDPIFTNNFWELMGRLGVKLNFSTTYHFQTDGQSEKLNQCIETYLRCMVFNTPKRWVKWMSLAEWWYNINFHTAIQSTPFKALYGYSPPQLSMGSITKGSNQAVTELITNRQNAVKELKQHLVKAQARMKKFADLKRLERHFGIGDWVYLKFQPYRQLSVKGKKGNHKLNPKYYGPYEILAKVGRVAYHLNLPKESLIHSVFHISQLKRKVGPTSTILPKLPLTGPEGKLQF